MKQKLNLVILCSLIISYIDTSYCKFLGGTISWMQDSSTNDIRFTYRLSWVKGTGPCGSSCLPTPIGTNITGDISSPLLSALEWTYSDGTTTRKISDINYFVTSVSTLSALGYEQGEHSFTVKVLRTALPYVVYFASIPWIDSGVEKNSAVGYMETSIDPQVRSDTRKINASPYSSLPSFLGVAFGCTTTIRLPADDPDGDIVRCRWAEQAECKNACTNSPTDAIKLSKANCTLTINAYSETGFAPNATYRLAIEVEDFSHGLIFVGNKSFARDRPLSRIPLQLTLTTSGVDCNPIFINPFSLRYYRFSYDPGINTNINAFLSVRSDDFNSTEIMASVPRFMNYSYKLDQGATQLSGTSYTLISYALVPKQSQYGYMQICFWVQREDGVTANALCKVETVADQNLCQSKNFTCMNGGSCVNIFNVTNEICDCPAGYKPPDCSSEIRCADKPCENSGVCHLNKSKSTCSCLNGFNGYYCDQEPHSCASSPCNNNGTCLELQDRYSCLCLTNFTGKNCESEPTQELPSQDKEIAVWIPVIASVGGLAALVGVSICIYKFKPSDTYNPKSKTTRVRPTKPNVTELKPVNTEDPRPKSLQF